MFICYIFVYCISHIQDECLLLQDLFFVLNVVIFPRYISDLFSFVLRLQYKHTRRIFFVSFIHLIIWFQFSMSHLMYSYSQMILFSYFHINIHIHLWKARPTPRLYVECTQKIEVKFKLNLCDLRSLTLLLVAAAVCTVSIHCLRFFCSLENLFCLFSFICGTIIVDLSFRLFVFTIHIAQLRTTPRLLSIWFAYVYMLICSARMVLYSNIVQNYCW